MLDRKLMNRGFEFQVIKLRKEKEHKWTKADYQECIEKAMGLLPDNSFIQEIAIRSELEYKENVSTLTVVIYWLEKQ